MTVQERIRLVESHRAHIDRILACRFPNTEQAEALAERVERHKKHILDALIVRAIYKERGKSGQSHSA
jgi:hypothetical protein